MVGIETKADFIEFQHGMTFGADNLGKTKEEKKTSNAALLWMKMACRWQRPERTARLKQEL